MVAAKKIQSGPRSVSRIGSIKEHRIGILDRRAADLPGVVAARSNRSLLPFNHSRGGRTLCVTHTKAQCRPSLLQSSQRKSSRPARLLNLTNEDAFTLFRPLFS
jgi:hypothetical protein